MKKEKESVFPLKKERVAETITANPPASERLFSVIRPGPAAGRNPYCAAIFVLLPAIQTEAQPVPAIRKKLTKKKFRKKSAKHRPNWPEPAGAEEAVRQNTVVPGEKKMRNNPETNNRKATNSRLRNLSASVNCPT